MAIEQSDAFVFFGATGDLAFKQIFPALAGLIRDEGFDVPIIGVARTGDLDALRARAGQSLAAHGPVDEAVFARLIARLRYVKGSDDDIGTFRALRSELGGARHPLHYLAIPPALFGEVVANLGTSGLRRRRAGHRREAVRSRSRRRPGTERDAAQRLPGTRDLPDRSLPGQGAGAEPALLPLRQPAAGADLERQPRGECPGHDGGGIRCRRSRRVLRRGRGHP